MEFLSSTVLKNKWCYPTTTSHTFKNQAQATTFTRLPNWFVCQRAAFSWFSYLRIDRALWLKAAARITNTFCCLPLAIVHIECFGFWWLWSAGMTSLEPTLTPTSACGGENNVSTIGSSPKSLRVAAVSQPLKRLPLTHALPRVLVVLQYVEGMD